MEMIKLWARTIAIITLLAVFIEIILPRGNLRRFIQVIMGLMLMLAILQPVLLILGHNTTTGILSVYSPYDAEMETAVSQGTEMAEARRAAAVASYEATVEEQVRGLCLLAANGQWSDASVDVVARVEGDRLGIASITVLLYPRGSGVVVSKGLNSRDIKVPDVRVEVEDVAPVEVGNDSLAGSEVTTAKGETAPEEGLATSEGEDVGHRIRHTLASLFQIEDELVEVTIAGN